MGIISPTARKNYKQERKSIVCAENLLNLGEIEDYIREKGDRNRQFSEAAKGRNRVKLAMKTCFEHVFGCMTMSILGGKMARKIELERNKA